MVGSSDVRKCERLVLLTTHAGANAEALQQRARGNGIAEFAIPKDVRVVDALPVPGTGKLDYVTMTGRAAEATRSVPEEEAPNPQHPPS